MPYTLMKGLVWVLLAVLLGLVIGWLLRSVAAKRQVERARSANLGTADRDELERLRQRVESLEPVAGERDRLRAELAEVRRVAPAVDTATTTVGETDPPDGGLGSGVDFEAATAVIGTRVVADDLTIIVGIGPKIAELCRGIGISTWAELAETEVSLLRTMLNDAGQRFKAHDPSTWPQQAALLANGAWQEFVLTAPLDGGRSVD